MIEGQLEEHFRTAPVAPLIETNDPAITTSARRNVRLVCSALIGKAKFLRSGYDWDLDPYTFFAVPIVQIPFHPAQAMLIGISWTDVAYDYRSAGLAFADCHAWRMRLHGS